ncbi:MAG: phenylalanine 4-monooxygenase [Acidobacteriota bacterium]
MQTQGETKTNTEPLLRNLVDDVAAEEISQLSIDHPGAHDPDYLVRRERISSLARDYRTARRSGAHAVIPSVDYRESETGVWRFVYDQLEEAHERRACSSYLRAKHNLNIGRDQIPQLVDLDRKLREFSGFHLAPIEGLVEPRAFLTWLEKRTMLCTQYVRHHSRPDYTPEPDIIHEVIGHIPNFTNGDFAAFSQFIGRGARLADTRGLEHLSRLYWYTVEFGLIEDGSEIKALGAGLLSSFSELEHAFSEEVERRPFSIEEVINTSYDYSEMQPVLFVIPSYNYLKDVTRNFIEGMLKALEI